MKRIGLMDCNNFFVSCERLFRPDLMKKPVAVLSANDGCIVARSQEVKALGISMGVPYFQVKDECKKHNITIFSSNFTLYRDISNRVMEALKSEFDACEIYSVDEAFFEVPTHSTNEDIALVRERIIKKTGIPVSFGIASTKTIAKTASVYAKKGSGVCVWDTEDWKRVLGEVSCGSVWGIGRQTTQKLTNAGIQTVSDLISHDRQFFRKIFGIVGERIWFELSGVPMYSVGDDVGVENQSISSTRSFSHTVYDKISLLSALTHHVTHIGEKLRSHNWVTSKLTILMAPSRFGDYAGRQTSAFSNLEFPTNDTTVLMKEAERLFDIFYDKEVPYKKAGVIASGIFPKTVTTQSLFRPQHVKNEGFYNVADEINAKFGAGTLHPALSMSGGKWKEKKQLKSPEYTTRWSQIQTVKAT